MKGSGGQIDPPEETALKKPSLIRVKSIYLGFFSPILPKEIHLIIKT